MSSIEIPVVGSDPFVTRKSEQDDEHSSEITHGYIHIRMQQRNGRKTLTTVQGIPSTFDLKKILRAFKKDYKTNGTIVEDSELGLIIQVQGDHRTGIGKWLADECIARKEFIKIHGA